MTKRSKMNTSSGPGSKAKKSCGAQNNGVAGLYTAGTASGRSPNVDTKGNIAG
jgi:hypothetical protein